MDFIVGLPKSQGFTCILVVVDRFTKYSHVLPLKRPYTAASVAQVFLDSIVKLHSLPKSIVSDRDPVFTSAFWEELFKRCGTQLNLSTAYQPQTDGQTERVNQCLEMYLRCDVSESPTKWASWLPLAELWYNTSYHTALGTTPFKALYDMEPNFLMLPAGESTLSSDASTLLLDREQYRQWLHEHLQAAQARMKLFADRQRSQREFQVGEKVYLKLQPYAQHTVVNRPYPKISMKFFGPYTILEKVGTAAYKLELPESSKVHPVFHVSQLKDHIPDHTPVCTELPVTLELDLLEVQPEEILDRRLVKRGNAALLQLRIRWSTMPKSMATWENESVLKECYPHAPVWGHPGSQGTGNVTMDITTGKEGRQPEADRAVVTEETQGQQKAM